MQGATADGGLDGDAGRGRRPLPSLHSRPADLKEGRTFLRAEFYLPSDRMCKFRSRDQEVFAPDLTKGSRGNTAPGQDSRKLGVPPEEKSLDTRKIST